jgi:hypothetical protein
MARGFTQDEQAIVAQWLYNELTAAGIIPESARIEIVEGSRTYGRCWYVAVIPAHRSAHYSIPGIGDLRSVTAAECQSTCRAVVNALIAARRVRKGDTYMVSRYEDLANAEAVSA